MSPTTWTEADTEHALADLGSSTSASTMFRIAIGQTAGIDPISGGVWFGESAADIWRQRQAEGLDSPVYCVRVGYEYYLRKGSHR